MSLLKSEDCSLFLDYFLNIALFLEKLGNEFGEVDAPILPDMTVGSLVILVWVAIFVKFLAQIGIGLVEEVGIANGDVVERGLLGKLRGELLVVVGIDGRSGCILRQNGC